jgi:hypothetical protein
MKTRLTYCVFMLMLCLSISTHAQVSNPHTFSDWIPRSVPAKTKAKAKDTKAKNIGLTSLRVRSTLPNADPQNPDNKAGKCVGVQALAPDMPTVNSIVLGPCCDCNRILLDGFMVYPNATLSLVNSTPNSSVPVTLGHGGPGRIGFSLNLDGPYTDTLVFNVSTNSSGNGSLVITFILRAWMLDSRIWSQRYPAGLPIRCHKWKCLPANVHRSTRNK